MCVASSLDFTHKYTFIQPVRLRMVLRLSFMSFGLNIPISFYNTSRFQLATLVFSRYCTASGLRASSFAMSKGKC
ncbi:uncharacterized protein RHIMIDRAFT_257912 [Rhizopus microsporus ATCC 52813]|uniref:Uncharacterized protein n=1 Tax=Rhizopus microsporus ATCC 52813 TaxID=1340429 RepID=A0A2G4SPY5_RHIZD|nr:uncharacterized protein RHIMIDRAFT_257912 [Rhizopus microsporus ATCC 52813]PHZ10823.1 hypothetical protein RHIMIDRAFT_257912 [Rhizopus microsporus ATCC 52813]